jgi:hypothetical protein
MTETVMIAEPDAESAGYRFSWGLAIAGGVGATAVTFFLLTLGSGFGLLLVSPTKDAIPAFLTGGAIYFFVAQTFGFAVGGHIAGRLLAPLYESHHQDVVRAAIHGFVSWAVTVLATLAVLALLGIAAAGTGSVSAALYGASTSRSSEKSPSAYLVDTLFRPASGGLSIATEPARSEASRILDTAALNGEVIVPADRERLADLVSADAGLSHQQALARIDAMQRDVQAKTKRAADVARKTAAYTSLWLALSLLFGAVVAMFAAVVASEEDEREIGLA